MVLADAKETQYVASLQIPMKIKRLVIENFKSIERIELIEPNPFTVFVGPNGSGKSNIFEALEFFNLEKKGFKARSLFGGPEDFLRRQRDRDRLFIKVEIDGGTFEHTFAQGTEVLTAMLESNKELPFTSEKDLNRYFEINKPQEYNQLVQNFSRIFVKNESLVRIQLNDDQRLSLSAKNLEKVLKRVLNEPVLKNEIFEWLELFVPEFKGVEVVANPFSGEETLLWYEQHAEKPFTKELISDGTYNILAMLTAVYQSDDKPQFLCIEEPENGLHPQVARELVDFFRTMCQERGHHIWLNTHSQSMISRLKPDELVVVEKEQGKTQVTQYQGRDFHGLRMDEALLMNVLGGGLAW